LRIVFQLSKLKFFPVTTKTYSKLEDLNGEPILLHSRGGGTDSIANVIESKLGMEFGERSYVPGSSNRVAALLGGRADATIIDLSNKNKLMRSDAGANFNVLEMFEVEASDEALFGNLNWIQENEEDVQIFVNALVSTWQDMAKDPTIIRRETNPDDPSGSCRQRSWSSLTGSTPTRSRAGSMTRTAAGARRRWRIWSGTLPPGSSTVTRAR
jgi:NitT/TauT family transport system substrate-binding protein